MKSFLGIIALIFLAQFSSAQQITPSVVSSAGGFYENSSVSISYTIAEMTMVETYLSAGGILTQGFQQPPDLDISVPEIANELNMVAYPNPSDGKVNLLLDALKAWHINLTLYDNIGRTVLTDKIDHHTGMSVYPFDWEHLSEGLYYIELTVSDVKGSTKYNTINKINIIK